MDLSGLYRDIVTSSPDGLWVIDLDGRTLYANPAIARLHRIADEELAALTVFDTLDEDGRAQFRAHLDDVREGRVHEQPVEMRWVRSDGTAQWVLCSETALPHEAGRPQALLRRYLAESQLDTMVPPDLQRRLGQPRAYADRLDLDRLEELRGLDDPDDGSSYVDRALGNFLGSAEGQLAVMETAAATGDEHQLRTVAHRLAGSALNLGAVAMGECARKVEEHILNGSMADAVAALPELAEQMTADLEALRAYQQEQFPARVS